MLFSHCLRVNDSTVPILNLPFTRPYIPYLFVHQLLNTLYSPVLILLPVKPYNTLLCGQSAHGKRSEIHTVGSTNTVKTMRSVGTAGEGKKVLHEIINYV